MLHDSGKRQSFETGAVRDTSEGKGRFDLIPPVALLRLAKIYEDGCNKYGERNFEKGIPVSRCCDSAMRHLVKYIGGWQDEDHLAAIIFNIMAVMLYEEKNVAMCNLPWQEDYKKCYEDVQKMDKPIIKSGHIDEETIEGIQKQLNEQYADERKSLLEQLKPDEFASWG